jgi:hypothetical protein
MRAAEEINGTVRTEEMVPVRAWRSRGDDSTSALRLRGNHRGPPADRVCSPFAFLIEMSASPGQERKENETMEEELATPPDAQLIRTYGNLNRQPHVVTCVRVRTKKPERGRAHPDFRYAANDAKTPLAFSARPWQPSAHTRTINRYEKRAPVWCDPKAGLSLPLWLCPPGVVLVLPPVQ